MLRILLLVLLSALAMPGGEPIVALVNPASALKALTRDKAAQILRGEMLFLGGKRLVLVLTKPSSLSLPAVTFGLLKENPQAFMMQIKAAKLRGIDLDPQFMDSPEAVIATVAGNVNGVGFLAAREAKAVGVKILPVPD
jgi:hypothetical protein